MLSNQEIRYKGKDLYIKNYTLVAISLAFIIFVVTLIGGGSLALIIISLSKEFDLRGIGIIFFLKIFLLMLTIGFNLILVNIFKMGIINILTKERKEEEAEFQDLFFLFSDGDLFLKTINVSILLFFIYLLMSFVIFFASGSIFAYIAVLIINKSSLIYVVSLSIVIACILIIGFYLMVTIFSQTLFILYGNRNLGIFQIVALSAEIMVENKFKYIGFSLGYLGWNILGMITLVGFLFSLSYKYAGRLEFYNELVDTYLSSKDLDENI